jgi:hypothetical protein
MKMKPDRKRISWLSPVLLLLVAFAVALAGPSKRPDRKNYKTELFKGVVYSREVRSLPRPLVIHTIAIDLSSAVVDFLVTPGDETIDDDVTARTTSAFVQEFGVQLAINGSFFAPFQARSPWNYYPRRGDGVDIKGLAISNGRQYSEDEADYPVLCIATGQVLIRPRGCPAETTQALAGNHILVEQGKRVERGNDFALHPRTAVAVGPDSQMLWFIVVDGRQYGYSEGVTIWELADIILELDVEAALNLDGGGSSTLVAAGSRGPTVLNAPIHTNIPMRQRPVANHLGVFILPPAGNGR